MRRGPVGNRSPWAYSWRRYCPWPPPLPVLAAIGEQLCPTILSLQWYAALSRATAMDQKPLNLWVKVNASSLKFIPPDILSCTKDVSEETLITVWDWLTVYKRLMVTSQKCFRMLSSALCGFHTHISKQLQRHTVSKLNTCFFCLSLFLYTHV